MRAILRSAVQSAVIPPTWITRRQRAILPSWNAANSDAEAAVTRILQKSEQRLGFALFVRERRRLRPTAEAQMMFPETLGTIAAIHALERLAAELRDGRAGILAVATIPSLAGSILPGAVRRFRERRPEASVTVQTFNSHEVIQRIAAHRDDLGIIIGPVGNDALQVHDCGPRSWSASCRLATPWHFAATSIRPTWLTCPSSAQAAAWC